MGTSGAVWLGWLSQTVVLNYLLRKSDQVRGRGGG